MNLLRLYSVPLVAVMAFAVAQAQEPDPQPAKKATVPAEAQAPLTPAQPTGVADLNRGRGKLFFKESSWDFGYVAQDAKISHNFIIQNVGDDTLFIERIKPT